MVTTTLYGKQYQLATTLRVAYKVQGQHNHKPYSKIFSEMGDMVLEDQIGILFCAFQLANPEEKISQTEFLNYYLDNYNMKTVLAQLKDVIQEIMGVDDADIEQAESDEPKSGESSEP